MEIGKVEFGPKVYTIDTFKAHCYECGAFWLISDSFEQNRYYSCGLCPPCEQKVIGDEMRPDLMYLERILTILGDMGKEITEIKKYLFTGLKPAQPKKGGE